MNAAASWQLDAYEIALGLGVTFLGAIFTGIAVIYPGIRSPGLSLLSR